MSTLSRARAKQAFLDRTYGRIARRYDLLNTALSFGFDRYLRRAAVRHLRGVVLDVGAGSGGLAAAALTAGATSVVCLDRTAPMFAVARRRLAAAAAEGRVRFVFGDARQLPFRDGVFDGAGSGFVFRNIPGVAAALAEVRRVVASGGRLAIVDLFAPPGGVWGFAYRLYLKVAVPFWGRLVGHDAGAYGYLVASILGCFGGADFSGWLAGAGFVDVTTAAKFGGVAHIVTARVP